MCTLQQLRSGAFVKVSASGSYKPVFVVCYQKVKGSLQLQRSVLRATQLNRSNQFAPCAKPSCSSGAAFAMAKAMQFQQGRRVAPTTKQSSRALRAVCLRR